MFGFCFQIIQVMVWVKCSTVKSLKYILKS